MPAPKRKGNNSPTTQKALATTAKFRKNLESSALPTGEIEESGDEIFDDTEELTYVMTPVKLDRTTKSPVKKVALKSKPISLITPEINKLDGAQFDGVICKDDRKRFWIQLDRELTELKQISFKRQAGRCSQILCKLKEATPITELFKRSDYEVELKGEINTSIFSVSLAEFKDVTVELGKVITVTAFSTIHLEPQDIGDWLELYGFIQGNLRYIPNFHLNKKSHLCISLSRNSAKSNHSGIVTKCSQR